MIRRIITVGFYTGMAHVISLFTISYILRNLGEDSSGRLAIVDSLVLILSVLISFGIQLSVARAAVLQKNWRSNYHLAQSARITVGLIIAAGGIITLLIDSSVTNLVFLVTPLIALNGDYALYGNGKPVQAARLSFLRVLIPNLGILISVIYAPDLFLVVYIILVGIGIFVAGYFGSRINEVPYWFNPDTKFYKFYSKYYKVGLYQLTHAFLITGIIALSKGIYEIHVLGLVYGVLKYFEIFKGVLRIIVQAFYQELKLDHVQLKIDKLGILLGGFMIIPVFIFPDLILRIIYDNKYDGKELMLIIFGAAMVIASFKPSADIKTLLLKKDNINMLAYIGSFMLAFLVNIFFSFSDWPFYGIPSALLTGELSLFVFLGYNLGGWRFFRERFLFLFKILILLLPVVVIKVFSPDTLLMFIICCLLYSIFVFIKFRKLIFSSAKSLNNSP